MTGHAGRNHVDSEDVGAFYAGVVGKGRYALDVGENLAVTMSDANTLRIGTGLFVMDGRYVRVKDAESVKVANGAQAAYRKDLVVCTYTRDPSNGNVEDVAVSVLQGKAAAKESDAKVPTFEEGDILNGDLKATVALAEVDLAGLTPTARLLLPNVASLKTLRESASRDRLHRGVYALSAALDGWDGFVTVTTNVYNDETGMWEYGKGGFANLRGYIWSYDLSADPWNKAVRPSDFTADGIWCAKIPIKVSPGGYQELLTNAALRMGESTEGLGFSFFTTNPIGVFLSKDGYPYVCVGTKSEFAKTAGAIYVNCTILFSDFENVVG